MKKPVRQLDAKDVLLVIGVRGTGKSTWIGQELLPLQKRVVVWDPHAEYPTRETCKLDELLSDPSKLDKENLSLSVVPNWKTPTELCEQFELFADLAPTFEDGTVLIVEECALLKRAGESLVYLATQSRHWGVPLVLVAQRAVRIHIDAREQCSEIVSFRQSSPDDLAALVDRCGPRAEKVGQLPRYKFWRWDETQAFKSTKNDGVEKEKANV